MSTCEGCYQTAELQLVSYTADWPEENKERLCQTCNNKWKKFIGDLEESWVRTNLYTCAILFCQHRNLNERN
jgi:hypothetical protein